VVGFLILNDLLAQNFFPFSCPSHFTTVQRKNLLPARRNSRHFSSSVSGNPQNSTLGRAITGDFALLKIFLAQTAFQARASASTGVFPRSFFCLKKKPATRSDVARGSFRNRETPRITFS